MLHDSGLRDQITSSSMLLAEELEIVSPGGPSWLGQNLVKVTCSIGVLIVYSAAHLC